MSPGLPEAFTERMKKDLGDEYDSFLRSYDDEPRKALRMNIIKTRDISAVMAALKGVEAGDLPELSKVPWEETGFYYTNEYRPGKNSLHLAGAYYIQEPSAMAPVSYLDVRPGMCVLDLCAAPGGKSTQIAGKLMGEGLLVANEPVWDRALVLSGNIERMGIRNALVVSHDPSELAARFPATFDRILVDAPCSGEGMFRKDETALREWSAENVERCVLRQREILESAAMMLKPGGRLVYSTCTFSKAEDEDMAEDFLRRHSDYHPVRVSAFQGMRAGGAPGSLRIYPQDGYGEGHFMAVFQRTGEGYIREGGSVAEPEAAAPGEDTADHRGYRGPMQPSLSNKEIQDIAIYESFVRETITGDMVRELLDRDRLFMHRDRLYLMPKTLPVLSGLKVLRSGLELGVMKKGRFEPSHSLAVAMGPGDALHVLELQAGSSDASAYISGLTLPSPFDHKSLRGNKKDPAASVKGWILVCVSGISLGWVRASGNDLKNHYPKGLRIRYQ